MREAQVGKREVTGREIRFLVFFFFFSGERSSKEWADAVSRGCGGL
jgi:hypothetical protein